MVVLLRRGYLLISLVAYVTASRSALFLTKHIRRHEFRLVRAGLQLIGLGDENIHKKEVEESKDETVKVHNT